MTIGIDIDDTITKTSENIKKYLAKYKPGFTDNYHNLPAVEYDEFLYTYQSEISATNELRENVKEAFDYFKSHDIKIIIITHRSNKYAHDIDNISINHLKKNGLLFDKFINTPEKGIAAFENHLDLFIDDKESNLDDVSKYGIKCLKFSSEKSSKYETFSNWSDIIEFIKIRKEVDNG